MTAVLGLDCDALQRCCDAAADAGVVQICNYNCPGQLVIGGDQAAVDKAAALAAQAGARRCLPLKVSGPSTPPLMQPAGDALRRKIQDGTLCTDAVSGAFQLSGPRKRMLLTLDPFPAGKQVHSAVRWEDTVRRLADLGVDTAIEIGPGKALTGFVKKDSRQRDCLLSRGDRCPAAAAYPHTTRSVSPWYKAKHRAVPHW